MREQLREIKNLRTVFRATVDGFAMRTSHGHPKPMIRLREVRDNRDRVLTDHVHFDMGKWVKDLDLQPGDEIQFEARVRPYRKGYIEKTIDYKLNHPTKVRKIVPGRQLSTPLFDDVPTGPMPQEQGSLFA